MSAATLLTLANGRHVDLLNPKVEDVDFNVLAEHLGKENRFNGATRGCCYSVAQHCVIGADAILKDGGTETEAAYFLLHDGAEAIWKDDPTPKKRAIAERLQDRCGVLAQDILDELDGIVDDMDGVIHQAAGLPWPPTQDQLRIVNLYDKILFVTEWRDLMAGIEHPNWKAYEGLTALPATIEPESWTRAQINWMHRARQLLPVFRIGAAA